MPDATITSTASTFGTISGTFAADQSTITGTLSGTVAGTLTGSVGVPGPGLPAGGEEGQIIVKQSATDYDTAWQDNYAATVQATVRNQTGSTLSKGTVVYISGGAGNKPLVTKASALTEAASSKTFAILAEDIDTNHNGQAVTMGLLKGIDTSAFTAGANLWLSTTAGEIVSPTPPATPAHAVFLGNVVRVHANQGEIEVRIQNGLELGELHDVLLDSPSNGQVLKYDAAQGLWINGTDVGGVAWGGITGTLSDQTDLQSALDAKQSVSGMTAYLTKAGNLAGLTSLSDARDNLNLGTANTPVFAGVTAQGSGSNVANLTPTSLTLTHSTAGSFVIQPSQGIVFPDATIQTTAYPGPAGATAWGTITGTLSSQTDLQTALDGKYSTTNPAGYITSSALSGYATESFVTSQGYITSSALSPYLTSATAASTYQTIAGMSSYLTTSAAASTYYPLTNPSGYITSSALTGYATESWVTSQGYLTSASLTGYATESWVTAGFYPLSGNPSGFLTSSSLTGYATESWVTSQLGSYLTTSAAASTYLTQSNAASTYQTISGMSSYLTTATAASTYAPLASPALTGNPTAPTPATSDNDTSIATTAFVKAQGYLTSAPVTSVAGKTGAVTLAVADVSGAAPLASPSLTGTPTAPTASAGTSTTQIATTAFVTAAVPAFATFTTPGIDSTTTAVSPRVAMDYIMHPGRTEWLKQGSGATSGAGSSVANPVSTRSVEIIGPNVGVAGYAMAIWDTSFSGFGMFGMTRGVNMGGRAWNKPVWASGRGQVGYYGNTTYNGDANSTVRVSVGGKATAGSGPISSGEHGFGWLIPGIGNALQLQVSNGTTVTTVTSSFTPVAREVFDWKLFSDGTGNVTLWINDSIVATTTAGPSSSTVENYNFYFEMVEQTASAATRILWESLNSRLWWGV